MTSGYTKWVEGICLVDVPWYMYEWTQTFNTRLPGYSLVAAWDGMEGNRGDVLKS